MKKRALGILLVCIMVLSIAACAPKEKEKTIAVVPWSMAQTFAVDFSHTAQEQIEDRGWKAVIVDPKGDWSSEYTIIENLITQQVDGIIYTAIDADGANDIVKKVQEDGIPIVGYDCLASAGTEDAAVRYDDYKGGQMAAEQAMEALEGKKDAKIIVFEDEPSIVSSTLRVNGFVDFLSENYPDVEVVLNRTQDRTSDGCYIWATDMITAYPETDAIFCYWAECTMATYNALQDAGNTKTKIIGYDATEEQQETMKKDGESCLLYASPGMSSAKMATQCVMMMEDIFTDRYKRSGPEDIYEMDPMLLNIYNAQDFSIDE
ncbi:sugar ABC transporter substrate-binding protein [Enterocloster hominis (ex Hitch et al. 2024)]|uniref:Sugar ABC transporter substrate-binding protein n=1 Tax=Enterocloster hominis (ex Hitch et al. 2024) TaxID=1917870 RepID=A0ABV1D194_9FIRM